MIYSNGSMKTTLHALGLIAERHKALSSNLANMDTPNYSRKDVSFAHYMGAAANPLETALATKMGPSPVSLEVNGGKIDPATELSEIQKNSILYTVATRRMTSLVTELKKVISMGNG